MLGLAKGHKKKRTAKQQEKAKEKQKQHQWEQQSLQSGRSGGSRVSKASSKKSFGGEMGKPGATFVVDNVAFVVLSKKVGKNRVVRCEACNGGVELTRSNV